MPVLVSLFQNLSGQNFRQISEVFVELYQFMLGSSFHWDLGHRVVVDIS